MDDNSLGGLISGALDDYTQVLVARAPITGNGTENVPNGTGSSTIKPGGVLGLSAGELIGGGIALTVILVIVVVAAKASKK